MSLLRYLFWMLVVAALVGVAGVVIIYGGNAIVRGIFYVLALGLPRPVAVAGTVILAPFTVYGLFHVATNWKRKSRPKAACS